MSASATKGEIRVAKKLPRGVKDARNPTIPGVKNIDATSGSGNKIDGHAARLHFSPMFLGPVDEHKVFGVPRETALVAQNFENYWQYGKAFPALKHLDPSGKVNAAWLAFRAKGYKKQGGDRHPAGTKTDRVKFVDSQGRRHFEYSTATTSVYLDQQMDYLTSRKRIYIPVYAHLVSQRPAFRALRAQVDAGMCVQVLDFDVLAGGSHVVSAGFLRQRVNDPKAPFGHGYVLAALLAGIPLEEWIEPEFLTAMPRCVGLPSFTSCSSFSSSSFADAKDNHDESDDVLDDVLDDVACGSSDGVVGAASTSSKRSRVIQQNVTDDSSKKTRK